MAITKKLIALLLLVAGTAGATKIVSQQTGNWGDGTTWVGGVVPGNGDEVKIFHVVSTTDTRIIGISSSSGTLAIDFQSTGTIHVTSTGHMIQRGYGSYTASTSNLNDIVDVDGGGAWEFDASQSSSPMTLHYGIYPSTLRGYRKFKVSGSSSAYASLYANQQSSTGALTANGQVDSGVYELLYASVTNMAFDLSYNNGSGSSVRWDAQHSSFTHCNVIAAGGNMFSSALFRHDYNYHQNTIGTSVMTMNFTSHVDGSTSAVREIIGNVFDAVMNTNLAQADFTMRGNFMGAGYTSGSSSWSVFDDNFVRMNNNNANMGAEGIVKNSYIWWDDDQQNAHVFSTAISSAVTFSNIVFGQSGRAKALTSDDSGEFWLQSGPIIVATCSITNSIFLLNGAGYQGLQITSLLGDSNPNKYLNNRFVCDHNTYAAGWDNSAAIVPPFGPVQYDESANMAPDTLSSFRDNLLWNPATAQNPAQFFKVYDSGNAAANNAVGFQIGPTTDVCNPSHCDYNAAYPTALSTGTAANTFRYLNQGRGYAGNWSVTPGAHDISGQNPNFVDYKRNVELFDSKWWRPHFGIAAPPLWNSGTTYSQGDVVYHSSSGYYYGENINFVYIDTGSCAGTNPEPGVIPVRSWEKCWKFQSIEDIKKAVASSMTFTDATIGVTNADVTTTLIKWVQAGYAPTNTAYHGTAHDGSDIGAVAWVSAADTSTHLTGAFASSSEKMARQDLWPHGNCSTCAYGTNWNGNNAYFFGAKGELLHTFYYLQNGSAVDATHVNIHISSFTDNQGHFIIPLTVSSSTVWDSNAAGPVNLFYYRYVQILGESQEAWDVTEIDARYLPPLFRVPCSFTGSGNQCAPIGATQRWWNRQDHDKFYPEIAVPYEAIAASSFTVAASSSQLIGMDVYVDSNTFIPAGATYNTFYATMTVYEGASLSTAIPIQLRVYNFRMPTRPTLRVAAAVGMSDIDWYHSGSSSTLPTAPGLQTTREHYYQFFWRHGMIPVGDDIDGLTGTFRDWPSPEYTEQLDGSLFTPARGFGNSIAVSTGVTDYWIGTYNSWRNPTHFSDTVLTGGAGAFCTNISSWSFNMNRDYPGAHTALYLFDEPADSTTLVNEVEFLADAMVSTCTMSGTHIHSLVTEDWVETISSAPHVDMPLTTEWATHSHNQTDWPLAQAYYGAGNPTGFGEPWAYNGHPPSGGTMFATEDTGQSAEINPLAAWKKGVKGWFLWETVQWVIGDTNRRPNDVWHNARTFGEKVLYASFTLTGMSSQPSCDYTDANGFEYLLNFSTFTGTAPNIRGFQIALATFSDTANFTDYSFNPGPGPSGTLTIVPNVQGGRPCVAPSCTCGGDATVNYSTWSKTFMHPVRGESGFNHTNGDGVLTYPGHDVLHPADDYNIDGPFGGFRLNMVHNGINMHAYATMASAVNPSSTTAIVNTIIPTILYELQPVTGHGYYWDGRQWSDDPQVWESNRELLAQIIAAPSSSTITSALTDTATNGLAYSYQITADNNPASFSATGLPLGLSLDSATGVISGIVTGPNYGNFNITLAATNSIGQGPSSTLVLTVNRIILPFKMRFR